MITKLSHISGINKDDFTNFKVPCTGSGPVNATIGHLNREFDEDLWQLFCSELEDFTQVESLAGIPYRKLEDIGNYSISGVSQHFNYIVRGPEVRRNARSPYYTSRDSGIVMDFTRYLLKNGGLPMEYSNGTYSIGMSYIKATILISNKFIEWYNLDDNPYRRNYDIGYLKMHRMLDEYIIHNNTIYTLSDTSVLSSYIQYEGKPVCNFKGKEIKIHIDDTIIIEDNRVLLLDQAIIKNIVSAVCKVVNLRYGRIQGEEGSELDRQTFYI